MGFVTSDLGAVRPRGLIVADDLTGAADSCVAFVARGLTGAVMLDASTTGAASSVRPSGAAREVDVDVMAVTTDTRGAAADLAAERVRGVFRRHRDRESFEQQPFWLFKKIDSTLRGPVGAEIAAAMAATRARVTIVAPAFPAMGRVVARGILQTSGPGAPAGFDVVDRLREEGVEGCVRIARPAYAPDADQHARRQAIAMWRQAMAAAQRGGASVLVCDSLAQEDLDAIVAAAAVLDGPLLWAGAAGLAHALAGRITNGRGTSPAAPSHANARRPAARSTVFAIGSTHPVTLAQQQRLIEDPAPIARAAVGQTHTIAHALGSSVDLTVSVPHDASDAAVAAFVALLVDRERLAPGATALVMSGGDTAARLCRHLGATRIDLEGEVTAGIPWGMLSIRTGERWPVVLKAGGFGADEDLLRARRLLTGNHDRST